MNEAAGQMDKLDARWVLGQKPAGDQAKSPSALWRQISTWIAIAPRQCGPGMHGDPEALVSLACRLQVVGNTRALMHTCMSPDSNKDELKPEALILAVTTSKTGVWRTGGWLMKTCPP